MLEMVELAAPDRVPARVRASRGSKTGCCRVFHAGALTPHPFGVSSTGSVHRRGVYPTTPRRRAYRRCVAVPKKSLFIGMSLDLTEQQSVRATDPPGRYLRTPEATASPSWWSRPRGHNHELQPIASPFAWNMSALRSSRSRQRRCRCSATFSTSCDEPERFLAVCNALYASPTSANFDLRRFK